MNSAVLNQPTCAAPATSLRRLMVAFGFCFVLFSIGCNADPSCRRETALLRAEILDIEDKYAVLQSRYESTALELNQFTGAPIDQTMYNAPSNYRNVILNEQIISNGHHLQRTGHYRSRFLSRIRRVLPNGAGDLRKFGSRLPGRFSHRAGSCSSTGHSLQPRSDH